MINYLAVYRSLFKHFTKHISVEPIFAGEEFVESEKRSHEDGNKNNGEGCPLPESRKMQELKKPLQTSPRFG